MTKLFNLIQLLRAALLSKSDRDFYDRIAPVYDQIFLDHRVYADTIVELVDSYLEHDISHIKVLDLGCGTGVVSKKLAARGYAVIGMDFSQESLVRLSVNSPSVITINADAHSLPIRSSLIPIVVSLGAWRHFSNPDKVLQEVNRIMSSKGLFIVGYFPPAIAGLIPLSKGCIGRITVAVYRFALKVRGFVDRADFQFEPETRGLAEHYFESVETISVNARGRLIVAKYPRRSLNIM